MIGYYLLLVNNAQLVLAGRGKPFPDLFLTPALISLTRTIAPQLSYKSHDQAVN
jgi:hypothetical protein